MTGIGDNAPDFTLPRDGGGTISLKALRPKTVVLYFYPNDDTPTCTTEAVDFSRHAKDFEDAGAVVVGVSKNPVRDHDKFVRKHGLTIALASDEASDTCERYGTWGEKTMYGRTYMGIIRSTFIIDGTGKVVSAWRNIRVRGHVEDVLAAVRAS